MSQESPKMNCKTCHSSQNQLENGEACTCPDCEPNDVPKNGQEQLTGMGQQTDFLCPKCSESNLQVGDLFGTQVCYCDECYGFVIDRVSFGELVDKLRAAYDGPDDAPIKIDPAELHMVCQCPACSERMDTFNYYGPGNVILDSCETCKLTWLDQNELVKIIRAPGRRELRTSNNHESQLLRRVLYQQAENDGMAGMMLLFR